MKRPRFVAMFALLFPVSLFCINAVHSDGTKSPSKADNTAEQSATSTGSHYLLHAKQELERLRSRRRQMVESFVKGEEHPRVKAIDKEIEAVTREIEREIEALTRQLGTLNAAPSVPDPDPLERLRGDVQSMNDQQLRATVEVLIDRLLELEHRVRRVNEPRFQLLH
jgi:hypothetical protein